MRSQRIKDWFINNILTIVLTIGPGILSVFTTVMAYIKGIISYIDLILIIIILGLVFYIIIKNIWQHLNYRSYHYPWTKINTAYNYIVLEKQVKYSMDEKNILHFSRSLKIKSCSNRLGFLLDKYIWTGEKVPEIKVMPVEGIANIANKTRIGIWNYFVLELNDYIEKGEERILSYKWSDIPDCKKSSPFFSTSTDEPTQKVILSVELGKEYANQEIVCEEFRAIESDYPIYVEKARLDDYGRYKWEIPKHKVKRFRHYRIRWSWIIGQSAADTIIGA